MKRPTKLRFDLLEYLKWELEQEQKDGTLDAKIKQVSQLSQQWIDKIPRGKFPHESTRKA